MFLKKELENGSIVAVKLISGDELIAKLVSQGTGTIQISKPIAVGMAPNGSVAFIPFMLGAPDGAEMTIDTIKVLVCIEAREELKNAYIQNTSGITPAGAGSVPEGLITS